MNSYLVKDFWTHYKKLPPHVKKLAKKNFKLWQENKTHPGLEFKKILSNKQFYSLRVGENWRVVGYIENSDIYWYWIGSHSNYNLLISQL